MMKILKVCGKSSFHSPICMGYDTKTTTYNITIIEDETTNSCITFTFRYYVLIRPIFASIAMTPFIKK